MKNLHCDLLLLLVAIIWGSGYIAADIALEQMSPITITALRFSIAALLFGMIQFNQICKPKKILPLLIPGIFVGLFLALGFIFQTIGLRYTSPSKNAFLTATNVVITPFIYFLFMKKKVSSQKIIGALIALLGIGILNFDGNFIAISNKGDFFTLLCALFFALHIFFSGYFLKDQNYDLNTMVFLQLLLAALSSWLFAFLFEQISVDFRPFDAMASVLYLGLFSTLLCFFLQGYAQRKIDQNKTAIILSLEAIFGTIFSILLRGEVLSANMITSFILLFAAILIIELKIPRTKRKH